MFISPHSDLPAPLPFRVKVVFCIECPSTSYCQHVLTLRLGGSGYGNLLVVFPRGEVLAVQLFPKCCDWRLLLCRPMHLWEPGCICPGELLRAGRRSLDCHSATCSALAVVTDVPLGQNCQHFPKPSPTTIRRLSGAQICSRGAVWIRAPRSGR